MRERILITGDTGSGKTRAVFSIAESYLARTQGTVYYICLDDGHHRFMPRVTQHTKSGRFNVWSVGDWLELRDTYRGIKTAWQNGDMLILERIDLAWDWVQSYVNASINEVDEQQLDDLYLERLIAKRKTGAPPTKDVSIKSADTGAIFWDLVKNSLKSVVWDATAGKDANVMNITVIGTELALPTSDRYESKPNDPRNLGGLGYTVQGEKNVPSFFETHILLRLTAKGYVASTVKDRERKRFHDVIVPDDDGFVKMYENATGEKLT